MVRTKHTRRSFLRTAGLCLAGAPVVGAAAETRRPNIVFVFADQMRSHVLGCYGNRQVPTPNFDKLAAEGVVFDNAVSTWPVCSPYRAMLLSGLYPMHNHTVSNDTALRGDVPTIGKVCKASGYATGYIGKWHLEWNRDPYVPPHRRMGFDDLWASDNCRHQYFNGYYCGASQSRVKMPGFKPAAQTQLAIDFIEKHQARPFCLFMSWGPPHDPYRAADEEMARFPPDKIQLRENVKEREMADRLLRTDPTPLSAQNKKARASRRKLLDDDAQLRQKQLQGYYALTKSLDDCMGTLLDALRRLGLERDTILAFSSDHGDMLGSHRFGSKQMPFEEALSIPFLLRFPRAVPPGRRTDALLAPIDVMPTLLGLAGVPCPKVDGQDLSAAAREQASGERDALLIMKLLPGGNPWLCNGVTPWRGVRTKRHTYARLNDRGPWLLFDNEKDPLQLKNLIDDPAHAKLRAELDARTNALLKAADDPDDTTRITAFRQQWREKAGART